MKLQLEELKLHYFKGIHDLALEPRGKNLSIYGKNRAGKTTIADAWFWVLFGKDSLDSASFDIKTSIDGVPQHGLNHEVEAVLSHDGELLTLRRVYHEVWGKDKTMSGHTTDYYIDGVPGVKERDYKARIASSIIDEQTFRLLTDPRYFNEVLPWEKRREIIIAALGDVNLEDIIASNKDLATLPEILGRHEIEDYKKIIKARKKAINDELEDIRIRVDETQHTLPAPDVLSRKDAKEIDNWKAQRNEKAKELANLEAGGGVAELTKQLREVEGELIKIKNEVTQSNAEEIHAAKIKLRELENEAASCDDTISHHSQQIRENEQQIAAIEEKQDQRRANWQDYNAMEFTYTENNTCPNCGQSLPAEQVEEARAKALDAFNLDKARKLEEISDEGKRAKAMFDSLQDTNVAHDEEIGKALHQLKGLNEQILHAKAKIAAMEAASESYQGDPIYQGKLAQKEILEGHLAKLQGSNAGAGDAIKLQIAAIDTQISDCEATMAQIKLREDGLKRIVELETQEKNLAIELERIEFELYLAEQYTRTRVKLLEAKINSKFEYVTFKMFNQLVNGGIEECCETLLNGNPYHSALSNSERIAAGLDIIRTLQDTYDFHCPVWLDNRESTTDIPQMSCQVISLYVSTGDKVLRVEED